jgi:hypothetical protein
MYKELEVIDVGRILGIIPEFANGSLHDSKIRSRNPLKLKHEKSLLNSNASPQCQPGTNLICTLIINFYETMAVFKELGQLSQYSDWLRAGRPSDRSSSPGRVKNFLFPTLSRPALGSTQPSVQWLSGREADHSQLVPRSRKCGFKHPLPHKHSWLSA